MYASFEPEPQISEGPFQQAIANLSVRVRQDSDSQDARLKEIASNVDTEHTEILDGEARIPLKTPIDSQEVDTYLRTLAQEYHLIYGGLRSNSVSISRE